MISSGGDGNGNGGGDEWMAADKAEHLLACAIITLAVAIAAGRSRRPLLRRWSTAIGSSAAIFAGAAKEAADQFGLWNSSGASTKDAAADAAGVVIASLLLLISRRFYRRQPPTYDEPDRDRGLSLV